MKVLLVNGSSNLKGCTYTALSEVAGVLEQNGIETEFVQLGNGPIRDCIGCGACRNNGGVCAFNEDNVNAFIQKAKEADGFVFGSPVYYAHPSGRLLSFMDRAFFAGKKNFAYKPAAAVVSARRAGTTGSVDVITKHFTISNMPVVPSNYWNMVHGSKPEDVRQDLEGMQIMRNLGLNMAWMLKCIEAGKKSGIELPVAEEKIWTNFIR
ncbi:MAG TPA: flavodoxin family protein [Candidatus Limenecus avicola]|jgi:flavin reductase|uniref:Flavodoxin family protein n=1 Tax=Candidatus Limenecus avicola TaxID=2840847 RepID=A0A9D1N1B7_9CLOT|nr:flavodoxin family protein [Clostridium sp.]HIU93302.1 flavodoxin family protein [Candidatus Limenecus avicola]